jgi:hypothetical protein
LADEMPIFSLVPVTLPCIKHGHYPFRHFAKFPANN